MTDAELNVIEARAPRVRHFDVRELHQAIATLKQARDENEQLLAETQLRATFSEMDRLATHGAQDVPRLVAEIKRLRADQQDWERAREMFEAEIRLLREALRPLVTIGERAMKLGGHATFDPYESELANAVRVWKQIRTGVHHQRRPSGG